MNLMKFTSLETRHGWSPSHQLQGQQSPHVQDICADESHLTLVFQMHLLLIVLDHIRICLSVRMAISILNSAIKWHKKESTGSSGIEGLIVLSSTIYYTTFVQYEIEELSGFS